MQQDLLKIAKQILKQIMLIQYDKRDLFLLKFGLVF